jgi:hypothetical protein
MVNMLGAHETRLMDEHRKAFGSGLRRAGILFLLGGCVTAPTQQQISEAYYGDPISQEEAELEVKQAAASFLKDPISAIYSCQMGGKGYIGSGAFGGYNAYGWVMACDINAKNSFGAYAGAQRYGFVFLNGHLKRAARLDGMAMQIVYDSP